MITLTNGYDRYGNRATPALDVTESPGLTYGFDADGNQTSRSDGAVFVTGHAKIPT